MDEASSKAEKAKEKLKQQRQLRLGQRVIISCNGHRGVICGSASSFTKPYHMYVCKAKQARSVNRMTSSTALTCCVMLKSSKGKCLIKCRMQTSDGRPRLCSIQRDAKAALYWQI